MLNKIEYVDISVNINKCCKRIVYHLC